MERNALGRGLSALIPEGHQEKEKIQTIPVDKIMTSEFQPRQFFSENRIKELASSIKDKGMIQPILVRPKNEFFEIIAGERRFRASKLLGLTEIPAIVKQVSNGDLLEMSLIENIQREDLNRIEEAKAYKRLCMEFKLTHEQVARKVFKDRATITNTLRLLDLPQKIQEFLEENRITLGHAKALLSLENERARLRLCDQVMKKGLSVRQTEGLVRTYTARPVSARRNAKDPHLVSVQDQLQHRFGTRVRIQQGKKRGKIVIEYFSKDDLNRILELIQK